MRFFKIFAISLCFPLLAFAQQFSLEHVLRIHNLSSRNDAENRVDNDIYSPKSVRFSRDGKKFYVNSLEGGVTVVYEWPSLKKLKVISHRFKEKDQFLFFGESTVFDYKYFQDLTRQNPNIFMGKPVESELSHNGRYLWVPYYRRDFDPFAQSPSAIAIIDTTVDSIVRVMPTGPLPKFVVASPDGHYLAVVQWGDNTVNFIDIRSQNYRDFKYVAHVAVEKQLSQVGLLGTDRDKNCGFCLRGAVFSPDSKNMIIARMGGGGLAGIDMTTLTYMGSLMNIADTPRHLSLGPDGDNLLVTSNFSGVVTRASMREAVIYLKKSNGKNVWQNTNWPSRDLGSGARTLEISPDGKWAFVAMNGSLQVDMLDAKTLVTVGQSPVDAYPVGLAVSPDGYGLVVTSQGAEGIGGNAVNVYSIRDLNSNVNPNILFNR